MWRDVDPLFALALITVFWILSIYLGDDGAKLKNSLEIDESEEQLSNKLFLATGLALAGLLFFVFFTAS